MSKNSREKSSADEHSPLTILLQNLQMNLTDLCLKYMAKNFPIINID